MINNRITSISDIPFWNATFNELSSYRTLFHHFGAAGNEQRQFPIETYQGSNTFIDLESCDLILLDGKDCWPIATLKFQTENNLIGNTVGWTTK